MAETKNAPKPVIAPIMVGGMSNCVGTIADGKLTLVIDLDETIREAGREVKGKAPGEVKAAKTDLVATSHGFRWTATPYGEYGISLNVNRRPQ